MGKVELEFFITKNIGNILRDTELNDFLNEGIKT